MSSASNAITGSNYSGCRSFEVAYTAASTAEASLAAGSYEVCASTDCYLRLGRTGLVAAAALPSTQPPAGASTPLIRLFAGQRIPLDVTDAAAFFRVIRASVDGVLTFNGPLLPSSNA